MTTVADMLFQLGGLPVLPEGLPVGNKNGRYYFVDGTNGSDGNDGKSLRRPFSTVQRAFTVNGGRANALVFVLPKDMAVTSTDPVSYAETVIVDAPSSALIGVSRGRTQGGLPQLRMGSGSTAHVTVRAPGCLIAGIGINGASSTGGGILLDDDGGSTKSAFGTTILGCHFKNCAKHATDGRQGGAINWSSTGGAWQALIKGNRFYKNLADVVLIGTSGSVPQDVVIEDNHFSGPAANVDCNLYLAGGSGMNGVHINRNYFPAMPAIGSGSVLRFLDLTACIGIMSENYFGALTAATGSPVTFAAAGTGGKVPTTVWMAGNWGETTTAGESGEIIRT